MIEIVSSRDKEGEGYLLIAFLTAARYLNVSPAQLFMLINRKKTEGLRIEELSFTYVAFPRRNRYGFHVNDESRVSHSPVLQACKPHIIFAMARATVHNNEHQPAT